MQKCVLNKMAMSVEVLVIVALRYPVVTGWNDGRHPLRDGLLDDGVTVVAFVGEQVFGADPRHQLCSLRAICSGTLRNNSSDRHTMRIHGQM